VEQLSPIDVVGHAVGYSAALLDETTTCEVQDDRLDEFHATLENLDPLPQDRSWPASTNCGTVAIFLPRVTKGLRPSTEAEFTTCWAIIRRRHLRLAPR